MLRFIFWAHTAANQQNVIPLVEGCDILVMEGMNDKVYKNVLERQREERTLQLKVDVLSILVTGSLDPKVAKRLNRSGIDAEAYTQLSEEERADQIRKRSIDSYRGILTHYAGQLEKIFMVDLEFGDAERFAEVGDVTKQNFDRFSDAIVDSDASWTQLRGYALDYLEAEGAENKFREGIAKRQLDRIVRTNPDKKIAVLYGTGHQLLTRLVETSGVRLQRQFADVDLEIDDPVDKMMTQLHTSIENSLRAGVHNQDHVDQYLVLTLARSCGDEKIKRAMGKMTPKQLSSVAVRLSKLWEEPVEDMDFDEDETDVSTQSAQRRNQTKALLRSAGITRRLSGLLKSKNFS